MENLSLALVYRAEDQQFLIGYQNDTTSRFVIDGEITFNGPAPIALKGDLDAHSLGTFGRLPFDQINDYPHFEMSIERHSDQGHEESFKRKIKTKPKHLLKMSLLSRWGNRPGRTYPLWTPTINKKSLEHLAVPKTTTSAGRNFTHRSGTIKDLSELAVFNRELDLHAERLFDNPKSVSTEEIFTKQMKTFHWFMDKAKSMNIDRVFVIHGVGSGRLKNEITKQLEFDPSVSSFANEHHPKYGFGATEIIFRK